jgi:hypothetical protein
MVARLEAVEDDGGALTVAQSAELQEAQQLMHYEGGRRVPSAMLMAWYEEPGILAWPPSDICVPDLLHGVTLALVLHVLRGIERCVLRGWETQALPTAATRIMCNELNRRVPACPGFGTMFDRPPARGIACATGMRGLTCSRSLSLWCQPSLASLSPTATRWSSERHTAWPCAC